MRIQSFINHQFVASKSVRVKKNPYDQSALYEFESCDVLHVVQAIQGGQAAFTEYKVSSFTERTVILEKIKKYLVANKTKFSELEALDQGLSLSFISDHGVQAAIDAVDTACAELNKPSSSSNLFYSPIGIISLITSWNLSLRVVFERLAPALAAGNAVIIKVSSLTPMTAKIIAEIIVAAGLPAGLVQVLISDDSDVKNLLISHPAIKGVCFVGCLKNASDILKKTSAQSFNQFKKMQIVAGSKNTAVALNDPNHIDFLEIMNSFMIGQGQLAWNSNRLFVLEKFEREWQQKIESYFSEIQPAKSPSDDSTWGPCLRDESFQQFSELEKLAAADQAKLIQPQYKLSDQQRKCFLKPTFTKDMSNCSTLQQDQIAAPLFILSVVKYPFDIAKYSNVSYYGQSAHLWGDEAKLDKIAEQLEVAQIYKNTWSAKHHQPNKGVKQSAYGILDYRVFGDFFSNVKKLT